MAAVTSVAESPWPNRCMSLVRAASQVMSQPDTTPAFARASPVA